jgi:hypothetical protein
MNWYLIEVMDVCAPDSTRYLIEQKKCTIVEDLLAAPAGRRM